jgi:adenylate cyclase
VSSTNGDVPSWWRSSIIRRARLCTGLVLFIYISAHLTNHSLGNYSLAWAESGLLVHKFIWQSTIGTTVLYGAFLVHFSLGLFALYERRTVHWSGSELAQLLLGLAVPPLLANHLAGTRITPPTASIEATLRSCIPSGWHRHIAAYCRLPC